MALDKRKVVVDLRCQKATAESTFSTAVDTSSPENLGYGSSSARETFVGVGRHRLQGRVDRTIYKINLGRGWRLEVIDTRRLRQSS
jgi:hypothetical protein